MVNYILRIAKDEWVGLVFGRKAYYTAMRRGWEASSKALFIKKTENGDACIGYGIIDDVLTIEEMEEQEKSMCAANNWTRKLIFGKMVRFEPAIPIKETMIAKWPQKGALLHGAPISEEDLNHITKMSKVRIAC